MGARVASATWVVDGSVWIYGGQGYVAQSTSQSAGYLCDLWRYTPPSTMTFIGGRTINSATVSTFPQR